MLIHQARLDPLVVLVFAVVQVEIAVNGVIIDLADRDVGINPHRLDTENFKCPVPGKADVAEARCHMNKQSEPPDRRTPLQHGSERVCAGLLIGAAQIQPVRFQQESALRYQDPPGWIGVLHVQDFLFIHKKLVGKREIIAVGIDSGFVERLDNNFPADMLLNFLSRVQHLYITSYQPQNKPKKRESSIGKAIQKFNPTLKEIPYQNGIVESLIDLDQPDGQWQTKLHEKAFEIDYDFANQCKQAL